MRIERIRARYVVFGDVLRVNGRVETVRAVTPVDGTRVRLELGDSWLETGRDVELEVEV